MDTARYERGGDAGSKGVGFQVGLLTMFLLNALQRIRNWRLSTENKRAGKFDDVVLEWPDCAILLQAKHKKKRKITLEELLSTNSKSDDFSLPKYFLSYQEIKNEFKVKNVVICTNASVHEKVLEFLDSRRIRSESLLYCADRDCSFFTVNAKILPDLKQSVETYLEKNCQKKNVDQKVVTYKQLEDFLERLQVYAGYPSENALENMIEQLLSFMSGSNELYGKTSCLEIRAKVMDWFQHKDGIYLTEARAKAMFSELRTAKYWQKLEQYKMVSPHNLLQLPDSKRIYYVVAEDGYLLQMIKIYHTLKRDKAKILFADPDDDIEVQKQVVEAFQLPQYTFLVIVWTENMEEAIMTEISAIIEACRYKKILLLTETSDELHGLFGLNKSDCELIFEPVTFDDFSNETREKLLNKKNIVFQGRDVSLGELFPVRGTEDFGKATNLFLQRLLGNEKVVVGARLVGLDESVARHYINRTFKMEEEEAKFSYSEGNIFKVNEKIILIADTAGMGKSTVLTNIAAIIKEKRPLSWVIKIELNDFSAILKDFLKRNEKTINILDVLNSKDATRLTNQLDNFVFAIRGKVVLMLDGVDEISPDYTDLVISLLLQCQEATNFEKVFVTTRPHVVHKLKAKLRVPSFMLDPFTEENQISFLTRYWTYHLNLREDADKRKCEMYAEALVHKMSLIDLNNETEDLFAAIPLQLRMLAEIFQESMGTDWEGCQEFLRENEEKPRLPEKIALVKLYGMFIDKKRDIFIDKENPNGRAATTQALTDQFDDCLVYHRKLALDIVINKRDCELFSCYKTAKDMETIALKTGIVQKSNHQIDLNSDDEASNTDNHEISFLHRTLAEYFVADSIVRELQRYQNENVKLERFLIEEIFDTYTYNVVLIFFDNFLQGLLDSLPSSIFQNYKSLSEIKVMTHNYDLIHKLAKQGCVAVLQLILKCTNFTIIRDREVSFKSIYNADIRSKIGNRNILNCLEFFLGEAGLNIKDDLGRTPLYFAACEGHLRMVKFLVEQGADVYSRGKWCNSPIVIAVQNGHVYITKYLLEHALRLEPTVNVERINDSDMTTFLLQSISRNNIENTMFPYVAACTGSLSALEASLEQGIDVDCKFENGETLIFAAARGRQFHVLKYLVEKGADIDVKDNRGRTALVLVSTASRYVQTAKLLIELGIDIHIPDLHGRTALHFATSRHLLDMVELLVESGMNVNTRDNYGKTALGTAIWYVADDKVIPADRLNCVKYLVGKGSDVNITDEHGNTIVHLSASRRQHELVVFFVRCGVDINVRNSCGQTVLHAAASGADEAIVRFLVELGMDVNARDNKGRTPLQVGFEENLTNMDLDLQATYDMGRYSLWGWYSDRLSSLIFLVTHGADVNNKDEEGRTVLHLAAEKGQLDTVRFLTGNGANIRCRDKKGNTPAALAKKAGHVHLLQYLETKDAKPLHTRILGVFGVRY